MVALARQAAQAAHLMGQRIKSQETPALALAALLVAQVALQLCLGIRAAVVVAEVVITAQAAQAEQEDQQVLMQLDTELAEAVVVATAQEDQGLAA